MLAIMRCIGYLQAITSLLLIYHFFFFFYFFFGFGVWSNFNKWKTQDQ